MRGRLAGATLLAGCAGPPVTDSDDRPTDTGGSYTRIPACSSTPCVSDLASAAATGPPDSSGFGSELATDAAWVAVGGPAFAAGYSAVGEASILAASDLGTLAELPSDESVDVAAQSLAVLARGGESPLLAVGALNRTVTDIGSVGAIYLVDPTTPPDGTLQESAVATVNGLHLGPLFPGLGQDLASFDPTGGGATLLVAGASGQPGMAYSDESVIAAWAIVDGGAATLTGRDAVLEITAPVAGLGAGLAGWDADGDGIDDVTSLFEDGRAPDQVLRWASPWTATVTMDDADDAVSLDRSGESNGVVALGDVTGDGAPDLGVGGTTWSGAGVDRAGGAWIFPGETALPSDAADLPIHLYGVEPGEGVGSDTDAGDLDGDGELDLVVGCQGLSPEISPGKILVFLGPLAAAQLDVAAADAVLYGENVFDSFGIDVAAFDADLDGRSDVLVGAATAHGGLGAVYLLAGTALFP